MLLRVMVPNLFSIDISSLILCLYLITDQIIYLDTLLLLCIKRFLPKMYIIIVKWMNTVDGTNPENPLRITSSYIKYNS